MDIIYLLIPIALVLVSIGVALFFWAVRSGQFDDLDSPAHQILFDDDAIKPRTMTPWMTISKLRRLLILYRELKNPMTDPLSYSAAFIIGLLGGAHCVGMCGGIIGALTLAVPPEKRTANRILPILLGYNLGRIVSYSVMGMLLGSLSWLASSHFTGLGTVLRTVAGLMLIAMGCYLANWWSILNKLEQIGHHLWRRIQPLIKPLLPIQNPLQAALVGVFWGWLPCGLIYSTLIWATAASDWKQSGMIMLCFGLGTLPAVMATGVFLQRLQGLFQAKGFRLTAALAIILFGTWTLPLHHLLMSTSEHDNHTLPLITTID